MATRPRSASSIHAIGDYHVEKPLNGDGGTGASGLIRLGKSKKDKSQVIIKELQLTSPRSNAVIKREIDVMQALKHKHTVSFLNSYEEDDRMFIVMNYAENGDLFGKITNTPKSRLSNNDCRKWFAQLVLGVDYMHSQGYVHLDIKPDNVFVDRNDDILLGDFGRSCTFDPEKETVRAAPGTLQYAPPEAMFERAIKRWSDARERFAAMGITCEGNCPMVVGPQLDMWALGATLYVMVTGCFPFGGQTSREIIEQVLLATPKYPFYIVHDCMATIKGLLQKNPRKRWTMKKLKECVWLRDEIAELERLRAEAEAAEARARARLAVPSIPGQRARLSPRDGDVTLVVCSPRNAGTGMSPRVISVATPRGGSARRGSTQGHDRRSSLAGLVESRRGSAQGTIAAGDLSPRTAARMMEEEMRRAAMPTESATKRYGGWPGGPSPHTDVMEDLILGDDMEVCESGSETSAASSSDTMQTGEAPPVSPSAHTAQGKKLSGFQKRVMGLFARQGQ